MLLFVVPHLLGSINSQIFPSLHEKTFGSKDSSGYVDIQNTESISRNPGGFLLYEDPLLGIELRYPSDWQKDITDKSVSFSKTDASNMLTIFIFTATVDTLDPNIMTLDQFVRAGVAPFREISGFELTEYDKGATLAGLPAHKVTFVMPYQDAAFSKTISYFAMINNTGYGIAYQVSSTEKEELDILLDSQLPTFQRMADSFQIIT
jgi:hypothetical protein